MNKLVILLILALSIPLSLFSFNGEDPFINIEARELTSQELKDLRGGEVIFRMDPTRTYISVIWVNEQNGREYHQGDYAVSNNVRNRDFPDTYTTPGRGRRSQLYYPEDFPSGVFEITGIAKGKDRNVFGDTPITTNAGRYVTTYTNVAGKYKENKNRQYDLGYMIHAGLGDYLRYTNGCIRTTNENLRAFAGYIEAEQRLSEGFNRGPRMRLVVPNRTGRL